MSRRSFWSFLTAVAAAFFVACSVLAPVAEAQRSQADCAPGWVFANGQCQPPPSGNDGGNNDAACQATAQFGYCQASAYVGCRGNGIGYACRLLQLSYSSPGQFQQIMNAQRACVFDRNPQACAYLQQFRGVYF